MGTSGLGNFSVALAYALALLLSFVVSGLLPGFPPAFLQPSSLFVMRIAAAAILLVVAVGGELLPRDFKDPRDAEDWHAGLVFSVLVLISWLVFVDVSGDGLHQPTNPNWLYTVPVRLFGKMHYLTPFQAEIKDAAKWTFLIGLAGRVAAGYRRSARRRRQV
jgi:hypothetical protein